MDTGARGSHIADMKSVRFLRSMNHYLGNNHSYLQYLEYFRSECEHRMDLTEQKNNFRTGPSKGEFGQLC